METIAELKAELQGLIDLMLAKGKREPNANVNVYAQQETRIVTSRSRSSFGIFFRAFRAIPSSHRSTTWWGRAPIERNA